MATPVNLQVKAKAITLDGGTKVKWSFAFRADNISIAPLKPITNPMIKILVNILPSPFFI